ncbi:MAG: hypothetical protein SGJ24_10575 [Chloroflexota bacterium]|nr:hypothetical protein [Chloroflexota bacterium]
MPFFTINDAGIERRLRARLTPLEFGALAWCIIIVVAFAYLNATANMNYAPDFHIYMDAARGDPYFYYAYWSMPLFQALEALPGEHIAFVLWGFINIAGVWFAARVFGGSGAIALTSYSFAFTLFYGQSIGLIAAGVALAWWGFARGWIVLAGVGLTIALIKYHIGVPIGLAIVLLAHTSWYNRIRVWLVPLIVTVASLIVYPNWVGIMLDTMAVRPAVEFGSIGLWSLIGAASLILWLPPMLVPPRSDGRLRAARFIALNAAAALALPYFQQTGLVGLYVLPIGWWGLLGNIGYAFFWVFDDALEILVIVPLILYGIAVSRMLYVVIAPRTVSSSTSARI